jgi:hypothetical protein
VTVVLRVALLALIVGQGCQKSGPADSGPAGHDADGDGQPPYAEGGTDCDDADATVYTGADEHCDGRDEDCDLRVDEDPVDTMEVYEDADGDGWGAGEPDRACEPDEDQADRSGDCDDGDDDVNPGAAEEGFNGVDDDCDASTPDVCGDSTPQPVAFQLTALEEYDFGGTVLPAVQVYAEFSDADGDLGGGSELLLWWAPTAEGLSTDRDPDYEVGGGSASEGCAADAARNTVTIQVGGSDLDPETAYTFAAQQIDKGGAASAIVTAEVTTTVAR